MHIRPGQPYPFGATWDGTGVNFAVFSENATAVELCLFESSGYLETHRIALRRDILGAWHIYLEGVGPGQLYGYRVAGPLAPASGHRFNPHKLLIDPYARALSGPLNAPQALWDPNVRTPARPDADVVDTATLMPKCVVIDPSFDWQGDEPPRTPWRETFIYEGHVKGLTVRHPDVPELIRGTYLGLAHPVMVAHLQRLGVTAIELLPVHQAQSEPHLAARNLSNYWGYNTVAFFAPDVRYASGPGPLAVNEFKTMVRELHHAGIEVILDVVYNHTAEGGEHGSLLSLRGFDNAIYYHLDPNDRSIYRDYTGCGNSLNVQQPRTLQLVVDSLRYWVAEMHVDGFRFDLATELCREPSEYSRRCRLLSVIAQDPILAKVKLIAEPWDIGPGGYQLGSFPPGWSEWNDKFRDTVRRFWRGDDGQAPELASRLTGSSDVFSGRSPQASINYVTSHDGFTLRDLTSYDRKHNEGNGEHNKDGFDHNFSYNWGIEGPTKDPEIVAKRLTAMRSMLATLLFSQGVPMLNGGDELGRTQKGNNNAYCQDNEVSWHDWQHDEQAQELCELVGKLSGLRRSLRVLHRESFFSGKAARPASARDLTWLGVSGRELTASDWSDTELHTLGMLVDGTAAGDQDGTATLVVADTILVWLNATSAPALCTLPRCPGGGTWVERLNTGGPPRGTVGGASLEVAPFALALLVQSMD